MTTPGDVESWFRRAGYGKIRRSDEPDPPDEASRNLMVESLQLASGFFEKGWKVVLLIDSDVLDTKTQDNTSLYARSLGRSHFDHSQHRSGRLGMARLISPCSPMASSTRFPRCPIPWTSRISSLLLRFRCRQTLKPATHRAAFRLWACPPPASRKSTFKSLEPAAESPA